MSRVQRNPGARAGGGVGLPVPRSYLPGSMGMVIVRQDPRRPEASQPSELYPEVLGGSYLP